MTAPEPAGSRITAGGRTVPSRAGRLNAPRSVFVEPDVDGTPRKVNRRTVALVREEWRVVDRWWTEEPVHRRYFDVVLEGGENAVIYRDEADGGWFSQRGV
jgi:hypothetical protein